MKKTTLEPAIRLALQVPSKWSDDDLVKWCKNKIRKYCKPCWELKYCPYGPLVEQFPLLPSLLEEAEEHNEYLKECLRTNKYGDGKRLMSSPMLNFRNSPI